MKPETAARQQYKDRLVNHFASKGDRSAEAEGRAEQGARVMVALATAKGPFTSEAIESTLRAASRRPGAEIHGRTEYVLRDLQAAKMLRRGPDKLYSIV